MARMMGYSSRSVDAPKIDTNMFTFQEEPPKPEPRYEGERIPILIFYIGVGNDSNVKSRSRLLSVKQELMRSNKNLFRDYHVLILPVKGDSRVEMLSEKSLERTKSDPTGLPVGEMGVDWKSALDQIL